jgi:uncharacterized membrane protein YfcA
LKYLIHVTAFESILSPLELSLATGCGFIVGAIAGMLGIGGSFLLVPILHVLLGVPIKIAVGSTSCQLLGPSTTSILARKLKREQLRFPLILTGGLVVGALVGTWLLEEAEALGDTVINGQSVSIVRLAVLSVYLVMLVSMGSFAVFEAWRQKQGRPIRRGWLTGVRIKPIDSFDEMEVGEMSIPMLSMFGLVTGLTAGLLGISGGLFLIPGLVYLMGIQAKHAIKASLVVIWIVSVVATSFHAWHGNVNLPLALALMFGGTIGAQIGSEWSNRLKGPALRSSLGWLTLFAAVLVMYDLLRLTGLLSVASK